MAAPPDSQLFALAQLVVSKDRRTAAAVRQAFATQENAGETPIAGLRIGELTTWTDLVDARLFYLRDRVFTTAGIQVVDDINH